VLEGAGESGRGRVEAVAEVALYPRPDEQLGIAVPRGGVDVVHAEAQQHLQRAVGIRLAGSAQRGGAEQGHRALVAGSSERSSCNHRAPSGRTIYSALRTTVAPVAALTSSSERGYRTIRPTG